MVQPLQSHCRVTKGAANCGGGWEGTVGTGTHPSQAVSLVPVPRCSVPAAITEKQVLARQGLLFLHTWDCMLHSCCTVQQTGTSHHDQQVTGAKGRPQTPSYGTIPGAAVPPQETALCRPVGPFVCSLLGLWADPARSHQCL